MKVLKFGYEIIQAVQGIGISSDQPFYLHRVSDYNYFSPMNSINRSSKTYKQKSMQNNIF